MKNIEVTPETLDNGLHHNRGVHHEAFLRFCPSGRWAGTWEEFLKALAAFNGDEMLYYAECPWDSGAALWRVVVNAYETQGVDLSDADLRRLNLRGRNGTPFLMASKGGVNLSGADLRGADLGRAIFRVCYLMPHEPDLVTDLSDALLDGANLSDCTR